MSKNTADTRSRTARTPLPHEENETRASHYRAQRLSYSGPEPAPSRNSNPVDQDIQCALQRVAMVCQRAAPVSQFRAGNSCQFLNADNPCRSVQFDRRREAWKGRISARAAQRRHDANQVGLKVHDNLPPVQAIEIELYHWNCASEASERREMQSLFGDLLGIGINRRLVCMSPQAIAFDLGRLDMLRPSARAVRGIRIQRQINLRSSHATLSEYAYDH